MCCGSPEYTLFGNPHEDISPNNILQHVSEGSQIFMICLVSGVRMKNLSSGNLDPFAYRILSRQRGSETLLSCQWFVCVLGSCCVHQLLWTSAFMVLILGHICSVFACGGQAVVVNISQHKHRKAFTGNISVIHKLPVLSSITLPWIKRENGKLKGIIIIFHFAEKDKFKKKGGKWKKKLHR